MLILGFDLYCHDGSACIVEDGVVKAAISEERITREKHCRGYKNAINYLLDGLSISINEIDAVMITHPYWTYAIAKSEASTLKLRNRVFILGEDLHFVDHYLSHAASSYFLSGFENALIFVIDGHGNNGAEMVTQGFYIAKGNDIQPIYFRPNAVPFLDIGFAFESFSYHLGFENEEFDAGKTMGLSSYGNRNKSWGESLFFLDNGHIKANPYYIKYNDLIRRTTRNVRNICEKRKPSEPLEEIHMDAAAFLQRESERCTIEKLNEILSTYPSKHLCLSGGVALNGLINNALLESTPVEKLYIPCMPNDAGTAVGGALYLNSRLTKKFTNNYLSRDAFWGLSYADAEVKNCLSKLKNNIKFRYFSDQNNYIDNVVSLLRNRKIVGWYHGGSEFGPRALGNRSILCHPGDSKMKDIINSKVKMREWFRPYAPVVLNHRACEYFNFSGDSPFMSFIANATPLAKNVAPSIVHIDGTARMQTLTIDQNELFYKLIERFDIVTGLPLLLNTSFNIAGEPIVETPGDAIRTFQKSGMDALAISGWILSK